MNPIITCKLTGIVAPGVDAHIIPRSFFPDTGSEALNLISHPKHGFRSRSWTGIYDKGIVTGVGEKYFSAWDAYACDCLVRRVKACEVHMLTARHGYLEFPEWDYHRLKLFFISVLWRAGVSTHAFFNTVKLGPHEPRLRRMILENDPGSTHDYAVSLGKPIDAPDEGLPMHSPVARRCESNRLNYYHFAFGHVVAHIKVDNRPYDEASHEIALSPDYPARVIMMDQFAGSSLAASMRRMVLASNAVKKRRAPLAGSEK